MLNVNENYKLNVVGAKHYNDYAVAICSFGDVKANIIVGDRKDYPLSELKQLKGMEILAAYKGEEASEKTGDMYHKFSFREFAL